ncbi:MFS transporter [Gammaproteobacteria bacterium]|nr:MFS transporter [Gammaproteobacteria bacterium]
MIKQIFKSRTKFAWCLYDWAHSVWPVIIITFIFPNYFSREIAPDTFTGSILWGHAMTISGILIGVITPFIGVIADTLNNSMFWLRLFTVINILCSFLLWYAYPDPAMIHYTLGVIILGTLAFEISSAFYNALLTTICKPEDVSEISGFAWGLGYIAGIFCLLICLFLLVMPQSPILPTENLANIRAIALIVGAWYLVFSLPLLLTRNLDEPIQAPPIKILLTSAWQKFYRSIQKAKQTSYIFYYLIIRMIYTDGINALFAFAGLYAANTFDMDMNGIIIFGIACNLTCGIGAMLSGKIDKKIGEQKSIIFNLIFITIFSVSILAVDDLNTFWILALFATLFVGPIQASSRSLMAKICPNESRGEFFGLYALSGRVTSFLGPLFITELTLLTGSQRMGMSTIGLFFILGIIGMLWLNIPNHLLVAKTASD